LLEANRGLCSFKFPQLKIASKSIQFQNQFRGSRLTISWCKPRSPCYLICFM